MSRSIWDVVNPPEYSNEIPLEREPEQQELPHVSNQNVGRPLSGEHASDGGLFRVPIYEAPEPSIKIRE